MKTKRFTAIIILLAMLISVMPSSFAKPAEESADAMIAKADDFWDSADIYEKNVHEYKKGKNYEVNAMYDYISDTKGVSHIAWDDEDTFNFIYNGVPCAYDYDVRMSELYPDGRSIDETITYPAKKAVTTGKNVVCFGPYYGVQSSFTAYYRNLSQTLANSTGGSSTIYSGTNATPQVLRQELAGADNAVVIFDSHGTCTGGSSYFCIRSSVGIETSDLTNRWAISLSGGVYGLDGRFMTRNSTVGVGDAMFWFAICEGMKTNGICLPLLSSGAGCIYGYSQSVTFTGDYDFAGTFWDDMQVKDTTVAQAFAHMVRVHGTFDPGTYASDPEKAYPIVVSNEDAYPQNPDSPQTVYSQWKLLSNVNTYTVRFMDWDGTVLSSQRITEGMGATAPAEPYREGHKFTGWDKSFSYITSDLDVYATYEALSYKVDFIDVLADEENKILKTEYVKYGEAANPPETVPEYTGYTFTGWDKAFGYVTEDMEIYTVYEVQQFSVKFIDSLTGEVISDTLVNYGEDAQVPENIPTHTGYTFIGWNGNYTNVTESREIYTIYAVQVFDVTFMDGLTGRKIETQQVEYGNAAEAPQVPEHTGYTFKGWDTAFDNITENTTVTAMYEKNIYTVTFKDGITGEVIDEQKVAYMEDATAPTVPEHVGYDFKGWDEDFEQVTDDVTVTALYVVKTFTVIFADYDGSEIARQSVEYGQGATAIEEPMRANYVFSGWDKDFSCIKEDTVVTAQYLLLGDVNFDGEVNTGDAVLLLKAAAGTLELDAQQKIVANATRDDEVNTGDAVAILKYAAGIITEM